MHRDERMKKLSLICLVCTAMVVVLVGFAGTAKADVMTAGLTFSEETGAFTLDSASGVGTSGDPILLGETVTGLDVTMSVAGLPSFPQDIIPPHSHAFFIIKHVTNDTGTSWTSFDLELQEILFTTGISQKEEWKNQLFVQFCFRHQENYMKF